MVRVQLRLELENLGCNLDAIKVHLRLEIFLDQVVIFGPFSSTLSDRPLWRFQTVHFDTLRPSK